VDANSTKVRRANNDVDAFNSSVPNSTLALGLVFNKGALLTTAMALFGDGSFLANRVVDPQAYYGMNFAVSEQTGLTDPINAGDCVDLAPMAPLFADSDGVQESWDGSNTGEVDYCTKNNLNGGWDRGPYGMDLALFIMAIYASYSPRWTNQLNSFAMMRTATAMAEPLPLMTALKKDKVKILDHMPVSLWRSNIQND
jgi:hypothetical protein